MKRLLFGFVAGVWAAVLLAPPPPQEPMKPRQGLRAGEQARSLSPALLQSATEGKRAQAFCFDGRGNGLGTRRTIQWCGWAEEGSMPGRYQFDQPQFDGTEETVTIPTDCPFGQVC